MCLHIPPCQQHIGNRSERGYQMSIIALSLHKTKNKLMLDYTTANFRENVEKMKKIIKMFF